MKDNWTEAAAEGVAAHAAEAIWRQADFAAPVDAHLAKNVVLRAPEAVVQGRMAVATDALALLAALPDQTWYPEDAILDRPEGGAIVTALRRVVEARHDGAGLFGAPTGRRVRVRVMTETAERDGRISDIWRVTDRAALLSALGQTPEGWAHAALKARDPEAQPLTPALDLPAAHAGRGAASGWGAVWADLVERAMEGAFGLFEAQYAPGAELSYPGGQSTHGPAAARGFWMGLRAAFPDGQFEVHHAMGAEAPLLPPRAALRWSLTGRHDGWGPFGAPTGAEVHVMGLSQAEFGPEGLRREWTLYDPGAVWMQIMLRKG
ncbi:nuclear transport factor 2 family protein [Roseivivax sediminis]|uniref:SnoaL-like domain-containing protein n=1 Tax=Roseivivax sediminis TaxID=936889 RepID=A0A1I1TGI7_9RHOB|nr:ester cyclase [Roseivivax sediminis]SFD54660.1 SnoaL-like domain-containing protein [Roseivivax sediminis]